MLKARETPLQRLQTQRRVITAQAKENTVEKARAKEKGKAQGILKSNHAHIMTSIILKKLGIFLTAGHDPLVLNAIRSRDVT